MLAKTMQQKMVVITDRFWEKHVKKSTFSALVTGKEPGHRMADYVDDKTVSLLKVEFDTRFEADAHGRMRRRSMGDVWIH